MKGQNPMDAAYQEIARIDAQVRDKLLKRARKQGMVNQDEIVELVEAWKRAAERVDRHGKQRRQKGH
jgi:hypothetical protein